MDRMNPKPDMHRVRAFLQRVDERRRAGKTHVTYPLSPSPVAQDAAIRKPLKSHGFICRSGFNCSHFLNRD